MGHDHGVAARAGTRLDAAMLAGDIAWWDVDLATGRVEFHENTVRMLGYDPDRFDHYEDFTELLHPADEETAMGAMRAHLRGETERYDVEYRIHANDGSYHWFHDIGGVSNRTDEGEPTHVAGIVVDITERREREAALRLRDWALDEAPVGVSIADMEADDHPLVYVNRTFEELTGYATADVVGRNCRFLQCDESDPEAVAAMREAIEKGETVSVELENERSDGSRFWNAVQLTPLRDDDGVVTNYVGVQRDVTARRDHERKLDRLRERSQALMYTHTVSETAELAVEAIDDLVDTPLIGFWHPAETGDALEPVATTEGTAELFGDVPVYPRDAPAGSRAAAAWAAFDSGDPRWIEDTETHEPLTEETPARSALLYPVTRHGLFVLSSPEPAAIDASDRALVDILVTVLATALDRVDREARLREREARLSRQNRRTERLLEATEELLGADSQARVTRLAVDKIAEVLELPTARLWLYDDDRDALEPAASTEQSDDLVGRPPTYTAEGESLSWRVFATGRPFLSGDLTEESACHNPDTVIRSELVLPLGDHGVINVGSTEPNAFEGADVTLTKLWARTVTQVLDRLEQKRRLRGHHAELSRERDRLEEFGSVVSHDLRNPLNVVEGSLTLARETGDTEHFERAHAAVDRIDELVDDLLALARAGEDVTTTEPVALEPVVEQCWETVSTGEATLVVGVGDETTTVRADPSRLRQLFENLFRNSVEHASPGVEVTVGTLPGGFFVEDDGTGIPPEDRDRVQERGYTTSADGTGFGLSIVAEVAAAHGWEMRVTAGRTGGARFEFTDADTGA